MKTLTHCPSCRSERRWPTPTTAAFTMIEIAISLAVIGFALVAIIGILPLGMNVQRENREETIINQDASVFLEALKNGSRGSDDLTNYVVMIRTASTDYNRNLVPGALTTNTYTYSNATVPGMALTNGNRIVGLLSTPKFIPLRNGGFISNYAAATVRSMTGSAFDKFPQDNPDVREMSFSYRLVPEITTYGTSVTPTATNNAWNVSWVNYGDYPTNSFEYAKRVHYLSYATNLQNNLHDLRLIFRWPLFADGRVGTSGRQVFCTTVAGRLVPTNDARIVSFPLFFLDPTTYTTNSL